VSSQSQTVKQSRNSEGAVVLQNFSNSLLMNMALSHKTWICSTTTVRTLNLTKYCLVVNIYKSGVGVELEGDT
jgi:hypothetical protein